MKLESIIKDIKSAGFGYVKVELEAELNRSDGEYRYETCDDCDGSGHNNCEHCEGEGTLESHIHTTSGRDTGVVEEVECEECYGSGNFECDTCEGRGEIEPEDNGEFSSEEYCQSYIMDKVSPEAKAALNYAEFYDDGSVDSELTFTIPVEKIGYLPEFIRAFQQLADDNGNGMEVEGAGMHIALLMTESQGRYPVRGVSLDSVKLDNFRNEVTKLLPALFVAACSGNFTRELGYRHPRIDEDKYSAIHIINGGFEYRVFETCYQRPEAIFEFLGTIARTLEYYKDPSKKVKSLGKQYDFYSKTGVSSLIGSPEQVSIIKKQLKFVSPKNMTLKELQLNRDIKLSVQESRKGYNKAYTRAKAMFKEHIKAYQTAIAQELTADQLQEMRDMERYGYFNTNWTDEQKKARVLNLRVPEMDEARYIRNNVSGSRVTASVYC